MKLPKIFAFVLLAGAIFLAGFKVAQEMTIEVNDVKSAQKILDLDFDDNEVKL